MKDLTIGKIRGLQQIAGADGILTMCAMDHRGSMRRMIGGENPGGVSYSEIVERKLELCSSLSKYASAVLLDPMFGVAQCLSRGVIARGTGLLVSIEASGYGGGSDSRLTGLLEDWGVEKIKRLGASAVKILVYYRTDMKELADKQRATVRKVAEDCIKFDIPFLVEPVSYPVGSEVDDPRGFAEIKERLVIQTAGEMMDLPVDVLKTEFPADIHYRTDEAELLELCRRLDASSEVPWVVLSAGVNFELFCKEVEIACRAGASGFLGGRAIWQEAMQIDDSKERVYYLSTVVVDRLKKLTEIATRYAVPWYKKLGMDAGELASISEGWYKEY